MKTAETRAFRKTIALSLSLALLGQPLWAAGGISRVRPHVASLGASGAAGAALAGLPQGPRGPRLSLAGLKVKLPGVQTIPTISAFQLPDLAGNAGESIALAAGLSEAVDALPAGKAREDLRTFIQELAANRYSHTAELPAVPQAASELPDRVRGMIAKMVRERLDAERRVKAIRDKGVALQAWGLSNSVPLDVNGRLRYSRLYRMNGMPTGLGAGLYDVMEPLVKADPAFLSRVTQAQLDRAIQLVHDSLKYRIKADSADINLAARKNFSSGMSEGYDYPELRQAHLDKARQTLAAAPEPDQKSARLGLVPKEDQPSEVLTAILKDIVAKLNELRAKEKGQEEPSAEVQRLVDLALAFHAMMGLPVQTSSGLGFVSVAHHQLVPITAELRARKVSARVMNAAIRSFPLGESILRLNVVGLWERGLTGKGVKIAVFDNGIDFNHPDLKDAPGQVSENFTRDQGDHAKGGHATPMASIIRAILPDAEIQSYHIWSNASLPGVKMNSAETEKATLAAMDLAVANGVQVINMSGGSPMGYSSDAVSKKAEELAAKGIIIVASAGNEGDELPDGFQYRSPATTLKGTIPIRAVDYHSVETEFSSHGKIFDAEGKTFEEDPTPVAMFGRAIKAAARASAYVYANEPVPYDDIDGTSPAAPHATGLVGAMIQAAREAALAVPAAMALSLAKDALVKASVKVGKVFVPQSAVRAVDNWLESLKGKQPGA